MEQDLPDATPLMDADDIERALLGRPASMRRSEISQDVEVTPGSARRFWHALGFQIVEDEEAIRDALSFLLPRAGWPRAAGPRARRFWPRSRSRIAPASFWTCAWANSAGRRPFSACERWEMPRR